MGYRVVGSGRRWFAARRVTGDGTLGRVLTVALVDNLLEEKSAETKDGDNGPDFQGGFALGSTDVGRRFVGACGVTRLTTVQARSAGAELADSSGQGEAGSASLEGCEC